MKKIIVVGENSYIGKAFAAFAGDKYEIKMVNSRNNAWKDVDFTGYDCILYCAGIAHVKQKKSMRAQYYGVNCDLTVKIAEKAVADNVKQFIFLSSMAVYGTAYTEIDNTANPCPNKNDYYGNSKLRAEQELSDIFCGDSKLCIVRPPMVYGGGCKGNFPKLVSLLRITPVFPDYQNKRSMIYIDNLCSFLCGLADCESQGTFLPQNREYVSTAYLAECIARADGRKITRTKLFNPLITLLAKRVKSIGKMFSDLVYTKSEADDFSYCLFDFEESVALSIGRNGI